MIISLEDYFLIARRKRFKTKSKSKTVKPESTTTKPESTTTELEPTNTKPETTNVQPTIITNKQELITMANETQYLHEDEMLDSLANRPMIMDQRELQQRAGYIGNDDEKQNTVYYRIVEEITLLDTLYEKPPWSIMQEVTHLMIIASYTARWLNKMYEDPEPLVDYEEDETTQEKEKQEKEKKRAEIKAKLSKRLAKVPEWIVDKAEEKWKHLKNKGKRRHALKNLQTELAMRLSKIAEEELEKEEDDRVLDSNLIELFLEEGNYVQSPTILFTLVMQKLLKMYKPEELTGNDFSKEMFNFLIANNDVIGSTSVAIQASGRSFGIKVGGDFGAFVFPCFKLSVEVEPLVKTTKNRLILSECQAVLPKSKGEPLRYALMNMNGRSAEATLKANFTVGLQAGVSSLIGDGAIDSLEINTFNCLPELKATANAGMAIQGTLLQVADPNPFHFNGSDEGADRIFSLVTSSNKKVSLRKAKPEICLWLYSNLYNVNAGVETGASAGSIQFLASANAGMWSGVTHYTYQTQFSDKQIFKTQTTTMYFQQVYGVLQASANAPSVNEHKKKEYQWVNSLFYESVFMYWQEPDQDQPNSSKLISSKASGYSRGHTVLMEDIDLFYQDNKNNQRIEALATKLGLSSDIIEKFLKDKQTILSENWKTNNKPDAVFLEATFIPKQESEKSMAITLVNEKGHPFSPDEKSFDNFKKVFGTDKKSPVTGVLQSLRLRTMIKGSQTLTQDKFKFGVKFGVGQTGFSLGRIEDGGSIKLTDLLITWYDSKGKTTGTAPQSYVPTSFLFM